MGGHSQPHPGREMKGRRNQGRADHKPRFYLPSCPCTWTRPLMFHSDPQISLGAGRAVTPQPRHLPSPPAIPTRSCSTAQSPGQKPDAAQTSSSSSPLLLTCQPVSLSPALPHGSHCFLHLGSLSQPPGLGAATAPSSGSRVTTYDWQALGPKLLDL